MCSMCSFNCHLLKWMCSRFEYTLNDRKQDETENINKSNWEFLASSTGVPSVDWSNSVISDRVRESWKVACQWRARRGVLNVSVCFEFVWFFELFLSFYFLAVHSNHSRRPQTPDFWLQTFLPRLGDTRGNTDMFVSSWTLKNCQGFCHQGCVA